MRQFWATTFLQVFGSGYPACHRIESQALYLILTIQPILYVAPDPEAPCLICFMPRWTIFPSSAVCVIVHEALRLDQKAVALLLNATKLPSRSYVLTSSRGITT